jgi:hypothetical protein
VGKPFRKDGLARTRMINKLTRKDTYVDKYVDEKYIKKTVLDMAYIYAR